MTQFSFPAIRFQIFLPVLLLITLLAAGCGASSANRGLEPTPQPKALSGPAAQPVEKAPDVEPTPSEAVPAKEGPGSESPSSASPGSKTAPATKDTSPSSKQTAGGKPTAAERVRSAMASGYSETSSGDVAECWAPLVQRLRDDPKASPEVIRYFCALPEYSPAPMGVKVKELFTNSFLRKARKDDGKPKAPPSRIYRNVVTASTLQKCQDFLETNKATFDAMESKYPLPREVLVALLYVETRLGNYVGKENAFWSLACMAAADSPERVKDGLGDIPITEKHDSWLQAKLTDKSNWAYNELRSYLAFCEAQGLDPHVMPGSVYGAIGICQFMPSNLLPYGDDGDGDGVVNLFSVPDAIFSAGKYLTKHGWQDNMTVEKQRSVLKRYNNLTVYANTILALAESVRTGELQTGPPDSPVQKASASSGKRVAQKG